MYMKWESVLPFYSLIKTDPQAQTSPLDMSLKDPVFTVNKSAALIFASTLWTIFTVFEDTQQDLILQTVWWHYVHLSDNNMSYYETSSLSC